MLVFSLAIFCTASATEVVTSSVTTSTLSRSNHSRALLAAMSPFVLVVGGDHPTLNEGFSLAMKSSIAILVASTAPAGQSE